ncbi:MAG TPA: serine/threonine-protein kinase [Polyangiales bacterium]|nr:serine/threonine-protein kinase [Polyangiales bacterium]
MSSPDPARPTLGRYEIADELGRGGMAVVYRVLDPVSGKFLAAKQLLARRDAQFLNESRVRFEREFHTLCGLSHPRIIEVYDYQLDPSGPFYTMELLDGGDLWERSPLPWREACALIYDVCSSLALLHSRRLVHCDVSPRNVRCTRDGRAKLIDFGAMVPMGRGTVIVGTPAFSAPEVMARSDLDGRTDLYSLGSTLYYALSGRFAFAVRDFSELIDAWRIKPQPPSQFAPDIPEALDRLVLSLLSLDASERPRNAFEVMQRLAAIADLRQREDLDVSQVYLSTPGLVGREPLLAAIQDELTRALAGEGRAVIVQGSAGLGRSRVLNAAVIAAKMRGACVVSASADAAGSQDFAVARALCEQLIEAVPEAGLAAADAQDLRTRLFVATDAGGRPHCRLTDLTQLQIGRAQLQDALSRWLLALAARQPIAIAVDDVQRSDEPSAALLAQCVTQCADRRMFVLVSMETGSNAHGSNALEVLGQHARTFELSVLNEAETTSLLISMFGDVPHVAAVGHAVHTLAGGNPRLCVELARHLVEHGSVRYRDGSWTLPQQLTAADLPESAETALRTRVAALTPVARGLLEAQALASHEAFTREDYVQLSPDVPVAEVDSAVLSLIAREFLVSDGSVYWLAHRSWSGTLTAHMSEQAKRERHARIAALYGSDIKSVFHCFAAGLLERGLDLMVGQFESSDEALELFARLHIPAWEMARLFRSALAAAHTLGRRPREVAELQRRLLSFSVAADDSDYWHVAPSLLERLLHDSGHLLWQQLSHVEDPRARVMQALQTAFERHTNTPEAERVYRPDEAIRYLVLYVAVSIAISFRSYDTQLVASLPGLLEPFVALSPAVDAIYQNALASRDLRCLLHTEQACARWIEVFEKLQKLTTAELPNASVIMRAIASGVANTQVATGIADVEHWIKLIESDPMQTAQAFYMRKVVCLQQGDWATAEEHRKRAEHSSLQSRVRPMFLSTILTELLVHARANDLTGVKQLQDRISALAARSRYWRAGQLLADGLYQRLCAQLESACRDFDACIGLSELDERDPTRVPAFWMPAVAGNIETLVERGLCEQAKALGTRTLAKCRSLGIGMPTLDVERALALAHARLGDFAGAVVMIERVITAQKQLGVTGLNLGASYEARARIAIWARDELALTEFADLTAREYRRGTSPLGARHEHLMDEARLAFPHRNVQAPVLRSVQPASAAREASQRLRQATTGFERASLALSLLCEDRAAHIGYLYLMTKSGWALAATYGVKEVDAALEPFARAFLRAELEKLELATRINTDEPTPSLQATPGGVAHPVVLARARDADVDHVGIALLVMDERAATKRADARLPGVLAEQLVEAGDAAPCDLDDLAAAPG